MAGRWHKVLTSKTHRHVFFLVLRRLNVLKTLWFNFRTLPFRQAVRLPVWIYGRVSFVSLRGRVEIRAPRVFPAMIHLGFPEDMYFNPKYGGVIYNDGEIIFNGEFSAACGYNFHTYEKGSICFGGKVHLGARVNFISRLAGIRIGDYTRIGFETIIMDSAYHFIQDMDSRQVRGVDDPVILGQYNWLPTKIVVSKGTRTPDNLIVASGSLLNKDYTGSVPEYSLVGGTPAKLIKTGVTRVWNGQTEDALREYFARTGASTLEMDDTMPVK